MGACLMNVMDDLTWILDSSNLWGEWMGVCACIMIGVGKHKVRYGVYWLQTTLYTEVTIATS